MERLIKAVHSALWYPYGARIANAGLCPAPADLRKLCD